MIFFLCLKLFPTYMTGSAMIRFRKQSVKIDIKSNAFKKTFFSFKLNITAFCPCSTIFGCTVWNSSWSAGAHMYTFFCRRHIRGLKSEQMRLRNMVEDRAGSLDLESLAVAPGLVEAQCPVTQRLRNELKVSFIKAFLYCSLSGTH